VATCLGPVSSCWHWHTPDPNPIAWSVALPTAQHRSESQRTLTQLSEKYNKNTASAAPNCDDPRVSTLEGADDTSACTGRNVLYGTLYTIPVRVRLSTSAGHDGRPERSDGVFGIGKMTYCNNHTVLCALQRCTC